MKHTSTYRHFDSPLGTLELEASEEALIAIRFNGFEGNGNATSKNKILTKAEKQLTEYFKGSRTAFDIPLTINGTNFEKKVWNQLCLIDYGSTITYSELAKRLGDLNKVRAVGRANGSNPLPVVIPCHRVIGVNNKLVGYGGGIQNKRWLLQHEGALLL